MKPGADQSGSGLTRDSSKPASEPSAWLGLSPEESPAKGILNALQQALGFRYFLFCHFPAERSSFSEALIATNWPADIQEPYDRAGVFSRCHLVAGLRKSLLPLRGKSELFGAKSSNSVAQKRFADANFGESVGFTLHGAKGTRYLFVFSMAADRNIPLPTKELLHCALQVLDAHMNLSGFDTEAPFALTMRETECLYWSAEGKTTEEIALILSLSPHTIAEYFKSSMRKLGAVTRMQAVARAVREGLI